MIVTRISHRFGWQRAHVSTQVFPHLSPEQKRGHSCVVCSSPFEAPPFPPIVSVPVDLPGAGSGLRACETDCAPAVGYVPPKQLEIVL